MGSMTYSENYGVFHDYLHHSSSQRVSTEVALSASLRAHHPDMILSVVSATSCDLFGFAAQGHAEAVPDTSAGAFSSQREYLGRPGGDPGVFVKKDILAKYDYTWTGQRFIIYNAEVFRLHQPPPVYSFILSKAENGESIYGNSAIMDQLITDVSKWTEKVHGEIWVFDRSYWQKSKELFQAVKDSEWKDVILDERMKSTLIKDVEGFFDAQESYKRFGIPWKRGIILHGSPGNGKTISIKAIMNSLRKRPNPIPTLYVKTFVHCAGPEFSITEIFRKARQSSPCFLVFEDLDSLVTDRVRSYFLNEVDGLHGNEGILILGSTNHLDRLDPAIVKRPSRFDRKYLFHPPLESERVLYAEYWRTKLETVPEVTMSPSDCTPIASLTGGFTFAYIKEAFIATLFHIFSQRDEINHGNETNPGPVDDSRSAFLTAFEKQVEMLREQMGDEKKAVGEGEAKGKKSDKGTDKVVALEEYQNQLMMLEMANAARKRG